MPSGKRHYRLTYADALSAHKRALALGGGSDGIPNPGLVESAISRPYDGYHRGIATKLAALVEAVAGNHGFADGNKRTTIILVHLLCTKSDYRLQAMDNDADLGTALEELVLAVVCREMSTDDTIQWFRLRLRRV